MSKKREKPCKVCKKMFTYYPTTRKNPMFCSMKCKGNYPLEDGYWSGKKRPKEKMGNATKTMFKKGQDPWNKGKSGVMPEPWNKGKKGVQEPWNKGIEWKDMRGENHPLWKGDNASYVSIHKWVYRHKGGSSEKPCVDCGGDAKQWSNISGEYKRDLDDYEPRCVPCHKKYDLARGVTNAQ